MAGNDSVLNHLFKKAEAKSSPMSDKHVDYFLDGKHL